MPTSLLEIVDLGNGEVVLQRAEAQDDQHDEQQVDQQNDQQDEQGSQMLEQGVDAETAGSAALNDDSDRTPLVKIQFSEEARVYIMDQSLEVAKAMIQAGIQAVSQIAEQADADIEAEESSTRSRTLH